MEQLGLDVTDLLMPWISVLISLLVAIWMKDYATSLAKGLKFKMNPAFNEGDEVLLDGELSMIVKIGTRETVFGVYSERGYTWRYVPNEMISSLKLEKVIYDAESKENRQRIDMNASEILNNTDSLTEHIKDDEKKKARYEHS